MQHSDQFWYRILASILEKGRKHPIYCNRSIPFPKAHRSDGPQLNKKTDIFLNVQKWPTVVYVNVRWPGPDQTAHTGFLGSKWSRSKHDQERVKPDDLTRPESKRRKCACIWAAKSGYDSGFLYARFECEENISVKSFKRSTYGNLHKQRKEPSETI